MLADYLIHTVTIKRGPTGEAGTGVGRDQWGEPTEPGTPVLIESAARVEWDTRLLTDTTGREVVAAGVVYLPNSIEVGPEDEIAFEGRSYKILARNRCEGWSWTGDPRSHWEIWIG